MILLLTDGPLSTWLNGVPTPRPKNAAFNPKPTILVRNLMRVFFNEDTLKASNYGGGGLRGYRKLDPKITSAIIGES